MNKSTESYEKIGKYLEEITTVRDFFITIVKLLIPISLVVAVVGFALFGKIYILPSSIIIVVILLLGSFSGALNDSREKFISILARIIKENDDLEKEKNLLLNEKKIAIKERDLWKQALQERCNGFPSLAQAISDYEKSKDDKISSYLYNKKHPAVSSSIIVKEQTALRRNAEKELRQIKATIEYYEQIAPFLLEYKEEIVDDDTTTRFEDYTEEEKQDEVTHYIPKEEYRVLSPLERNEKALRNFWNLPKSKRIIGKIYEQFIGQTFEQKGYNVEYHGIFKGYEDLGRDLICTKGSEIVVVQCKNWAQFKTIYENHIFQFFGTVFKYKDENRDKNVTAVFCTSTKVSDLAKRFAKELGIKISENVKLDKGYPCIKCNISKRDNTKIYHLPFDQQYDNVKIEPNKGEFYCATVKEAEASGFRRAFRYRGLTKKLNHRK